MTASQDDRMSLLNVGNGVLGAGWTYLLGPAKLMSLSRRQVGAVHGLLDTIRNESNGASQEQRRALFSEHIASALTVSQKPAPEPKVPVSRETEPRDVGGAAGRRVCKVCEESKPLEEFRTSGRGRRRLCKPCESEQSKQRYAAKGPSVKGQRRVDALLPVAAFGSEFLGLSRPVPCGECDGAGVVDGPETFGAVLEHITMRAGGNPKRFDPAAVPVGRVQVLADELDRALGDVVAFLYELRERIDAADEDEATT